MNPTPQWIRFVGTMVFTAIMAFDTIHVQDSATVDSTDSPLSLIDKAKALDSEDKDESAIQLLKAGIVKYPISKELYAYLATLYFGNGDFEKAAHAEERVVELAPKDRIAWAWLGVCRAALKQDSAEQEAFQKAKALDGVLDPNGDFSLIDALIDYNATEMLQAAAQAEESDPERSMELASEASNELLANGNLREAKQWLRKAALLGDESSYWRLRSYRVMDFVTASRWQLANLLHIPDGDSLAVHVPNIPGLVMFIAFFVGMILMVPLFAISLLVLGFFNLRRLEEEHWTERARVVYPVRIYIALLMKLICLMTAFSVFLFPSGDFKIGRGLSALLIYCVTFYPFCILYAKYAFVLGLERRMTWMAALRYFAALFLLIRSAEFLYLTLFSFSLDFHNPWIIVFILLLWSGAITWFYGAGSWQMLKGLGIVYLLPETIPLKLEEVGLSKAVYGLDIEYCNVLRCANGVRLLTKRVQEIVAVDEIASYFAYHNAIVPAPSLKRWYTWRALLFTVLVFSSPAWLYWIPFNNPDFVIIFLAGCWLVFAVFLASAFVFNKSIDRKQRVIVSIDYVLTMTFFWVLFGMFNYRLNGFFIFYMIANAIYAIFRIYVILAIILFRKADEEIKVKYLNKHLIVLEKIYKENNSPVVIHAKTNPPSLYDKMVNAGIPPEYPRPKAIPRTAPPPLALLTALLFALGFVLTISVLVP